MQRVPTWTFIILIGCMILSALLLMVQTQRATDRAMAIQRLSEQLERIAVDRYDARQSMKHQDLAPRGSSSTTDTADTNTRARVVAQLFPPENACDYVWNADAPNTTIPYLNKRWGFSMQLPFNDQWGNDSYRILPYIEEGSEADGVLLFGPLSTGGACGLSPAYALQVMPSRTSAEAITEIMASAETVGPLEQAPRRETMGQQQVVTYATSELCAGGTIEIIGKTHNYVLGGCAAELSTLRGFVKTMNLLP